MTVVLLTLLSRHWPLENVLMFSLINPLAGDIQDRGYCAGFNLLTTKGIEHRSAFL
jgi:hypothetical protein